jgi:hypothetical protein
MTTITIEVHYPPTDMPDADTDVLIQVEGEDEMQLGALDCTDPVLWVGAQGEPVGRVVAWTEMPRVSESRHVETVTGQRIDLAEPWRVPA